MRPNTHGRPFAGALLLALTPLPDGWSEPLFRLVLWGLLVWISFEAVEAATSWSRHSPGPEVAALLATLLDRALIGLVLLVAFFLCVLGGDLLLRTLSGQGPAAGGLGFIALAGGLAAFWLVARSRLREDAGGGRFDRERRNVRD